MPGAYTLEEAAMPVARVLQEAAKLSVLVHKNITPSLIQLTLVLRPKPSDLGASTGEPRNAGKVD